MPKKTRSRPKGSVALVSDSPSKKSAQKKSAKVPNQPPRRKSWMGPFFSLIFKFYAAFSLYQYLWTCPSDGSDPRKICQIGDKTLDFVYPYVEEYYSTYAEPYYSQYVSPYVEQATPYVKLANEKYIQPATAYATDQFEKHGRPQVELAKDKVMAEYTRVVAPQVAQLTAQGRVYYNDYLADHVATGHELYVAYGPVVEKAMKDGYAVAYEKGYPYYIAALPYIEKAWEQAVETTGWVGIEGKGWVARRWGMHVEPQLWRIQERLGKKSIHESHATPAKDTKSTPSHTTNPNTSSSDTQPVPVPEPEPVKDQIKDEINDQIDEQSKDETKEKTKEEIRAEVEADLKIWMTKFEEAGAKATTEVVTKLNELCEKVLEEQTPLSFDLLKDLDNRVKLEFKAYKEGSESLQDSPAQLEYILIGFDNMVQSVLSGIQAKQAEITQHTQNFLMDTYQNTAKIVDAALADMDSVHDLGMQELGMKWAWMDGITYKDWETYHELKKTFPTLKTKVIRSGQGHKRLREVTDYAKSINDAAAEVVKVATAEIHAKEEIDRPKLVEKGNVDDGNEPVVNDDETVSATEDVLVESTETSNVEEMGEIEIDNHGQIVQEAPQSEATNLESEPEADTEEQQTEEPELTEPVTSPVDEIGEVEIDNQGQVVTEKQSEAELVSEPPLEVQQQSHMEDLGLEVDNHGNPIGEPETNAHEAEEDKTVQKEEL